MRGGPEIVATRVAANARAWWCISYQSGIKLLVEICDDATGAKRELHT